MEITYDLIIEYLGNKDNYNNTSTDFITRKNIYNYSINFPDKFKNILTDKFYRYGITTNDDENNNISFWSSLLTLLDKNFIIPYSSDEIELINQFKSQIIEKYSKSKISSFVKKLNKNDLRERFKLDPDIYTLQYLVDIIDVNILIFDWESTNIYTVFRNNLMNPWKKTLLFAKFNKHWEPIIMVKNKGDTERLFDYNNLTIKKILNTNNLISYFENEKINKQFILDEDIYSILQQEKKNILIKNKLNKSNDTESEQKDIESEQKDSSELSIKTDSDEINNEELLEFKKLNKTKLTKMKLELLLNIVNKFNIVITKDKPTKSILITLILEKITELKSN